jgi:hypothetical protein
MGVDEVHAVPHAANASAAILGYAIFIAPVMLGLLLIQSWSFLGFLWRTAILAIGVLILIRLIRWVKEPASNKLHYAIPTWVLISLGGALLVAGFIVGVLMVALSDGPV